MTYETPVEEIGTMKRRGKTMRFELEEETKPEQSLLEKYASVVDKYESLKGREEMADMMISAAAGINDHIEAGEPDKADTLYEGTVEAFIEHNHSMIKTYLYVLHDVLEANENGSWRKNDRDTAKMQYEQGNTAMILRDKTDDELARFRYTVDQVTFPRQLEQMKKQLIEGGQATQFKLSYIGYRKAFVEFEQRVTEKTDLGELETMLNETQDPNRRKHIKGHMAYLREQANQTEEPETRVDTRSSLGDLLLGTDE